MQLSLTRMLVLTLIIVAGYSVRYQEEHDAGCTQDCPSGYTGFGSQCFQNCPATWRNDGFFCRHAEYGRGVGYPWKFGDGFNDRGMFARCEAAHGKGHCEKWGLVVYPKCMFGYHPFGCCICRPAAPDCKSLGMNPGIDLSCAKKVVPKCR